MAILLPSFFLSWVAMFLLYWKIWREAHMHARRMNLSVVPNISEKNDRKSVQVSIYCNVLNRVIQKIASDEAIKFKFYKRSDRQ